MCNFSQEDVALFRNANISRRHFSLAARTGAHEKQKNIAQRYHSPSSNISAMMSSLGTMGGVKWGMILPAAQFPRKSQLSYGDDLSSTGIVLADDPRILVATHRSTPTLNSTLPPFLRSRTAATSVPECRVTLYAPSDNCSVKTAYRRGLTHPLFVPIVHPAVRPKDSTLPLALRASRVVTIAAVRCNFTPVPERRRRIIIPTR